MSSLLEHAVKFLRSLLQEEQDRAAKVLLTFLGRPWADAALDDGGDEEREDEEERSPVRVPLFLRTLGGDNSLAITDFCS